jgi:hypothetical protein
MKIFWLFLFFTSVVFSQNAYLESPINTVIWNENYKLEWKDFKGVLDPNIFANALTTYKIEIIPENVLVDAEDNIQDYKNLTVVAKFIKDKSWSISKSDNLLAHEQLHFDIVELFSRKIRKKFNELKSENEQRFSIYASAYELLWQECRKYQKKYDSETESGILIDENNIWINKIKQEISDLDKYR